MKQTYDNFKRILSRSKEYEFDNHSVLVLRDYYTGDTVRLDLSRITPEMFDEIKEEEPKAAVWTRCRENIESWEERAGRALESINKMRCGLEQADITLYNAIQREIEEYCWDNDYDECDLGIVPDDILFYVDD